MYNGNAPTKATVLIRLGNELSLFEVNIPQKSGFAGDLNPPHRVAVIHATGSGDQFDLNFVDEVSGNGTVVPPPPTQSFYVSLSWPTVNANLDLHIRDIANNHIYKYNAGGSYGKLFGDVQNGGDRSEIYESNTADNIVGNYTIGVNYYSGSGPENANVKIVIGENVIELNKTLLVPLGRAGDTVVPYVFGDLQIFKLPNGQINGTFTAYTPECL